MSEPTQTTLEEASRCSKCSNPGKFDGERALRSAAGAKLKVFRCMNSRCKWYDTTWSVQVNANGTIPPPLSVRPKQFEALPDDGGRVMAGLERQLELEQKPGAELPRRY